MKAVIQGFLLILTRHNYLEVLVPNHWFMREIVVGTVGNLLQFV